MTEHSPSQPPPCEILVTQFDEGRKELRFCLDHDGFAEWCPSPDDAPPAEPAPASDAARSQS